MILLILTAEQNPTRRRTISLFPYQPLTVIERLATVTSAALFVPLVGSCTKGNHFDFIT